MTVTYCYLCGDTIRRGQAAVPARALSVRQPWSWLIVNGHKDVENRTWSTNYRGPFVIHAPQRIDERAYPWCHRLGIEVPAQLETSALVGVVTLDQVTQRYRSDWSLPGHYHWVLSNATELTVPLPAHGRLGFFATELRSHDDCAIEWGAPAHTHRRVR